MLATSSELLRNKPNWREQKAIYSTAWRTNGSRAIFLLGTLRGDAWRPVCMPRCPYEVNHLEIIIDNAVVEIAAEASWQAPILCSNASSGQLSVAKQMEWSHSQTCDFSVFRRLHMQGEAQRSLATETL
jgi:hypothetical protein